MSDFAGIENAKTTERLPYFNPGTYLGELQTAKRFDSRNKGRMAVSEWKIIEAAGTGANEVGTTVAYLIKITGNDSALGNIKGVVAAVGDLPASDVTGQDAEELFPLNPPMNFTHPAQGVKCRIEATNVTTKAGKPFTALRFSPYHAPSVAAPPVAGEASTSAPSETKAKGKK